VINKKKRMIVILSLGEVSYSAPVELLPEHIKKCFGLSLRAFGGREPPG
jgi:hypothetical protein